MKLSVKDPSAKLETAVNFFLYGSEHVTKAKLFNFEFFIKENQRHNLLLRNSNKILNEYKLSLNEWIVLNMILDKRELSAIKQANNLDSSYLLRLLKSLTVKLYIAGEYLPEDKRIKYYTITNLGLAVLKESNKNLDKELHKILKDLKFTAHLNTAN